MTGQRAAMVLSYSHIDSDPRVRRQIDWLTRAGWDVDTLGLGDSTSDGWNRHFPLNPPSRWSTTRAGAFVTQVLLPHRAGYRRQFTARVPAEALSSIRSGHYQLVVFNEPEFGPLIADPQVFTEAALQAHLHLDIHEYHGADRRHQTFGGWLAAGHYRWIRSFIGAPAFASRTVVNEPIGQMLAHEFKMPMPHVVRNVPDFVDQGPSAVDPSRIRLLFHGMGARGSRGFEEILDAMRTLSDKFTMTFMLMPDPQVLPWLEELVQAHPSRDRIAIVPPAPMREISERINEFDLEVIFYRPLDKNLEFALPNKFFEAVQGRLGLVVSESSEMAALVRQFSLGIVVEGFGGPDLERALRPLTVADVAQFKTASHRAALTLNAANEGRLFIASLGDIC